LKLGVVGPEQAKFTSATEALARAVIREAAVRHGATALVSGHCPLGGVDIFAEEEAAAMGLQMIVFAPKVLSWEGPGGYRARNLMIARTSDLVLMVALSELPLGFRGEDYGECYHCKGRNPPHVKSGGCWTAWRCRDREWVVIPG
jgi:hypothetical protein